MLNQYEREHTFLTLERILLRRNNRTIFTCSNNAGELFLCIKNNEQDGIAVKVNSNTVSNLLNGKVTLRDAFLSDNNSIYAMSLDENPFELFDSWKIVDTNLLPCAGEFI